MTANTAMTVTTATDVTTVRQTTSQTALPTTTTMNDHTPVVPDLSVDDETFVQIRNYIPDIVVELKYATADNFTGQIIYDFEDAFLRYGTVKKLRAVQDTLREQRLSLKIWDAFRPVSAQFRLWEVYPDATFVANPQTGYSSHSRGNTVDLTIVDANGNELVMPSAFDDFSSAADRNYNDCGEDVKRNAVLLETLMEEQGFEAYFNEWWHYSDTVSYPVETTFSPSNQKDRY